jgi:ADP-sugar diphosphatase
MIEKMIVCKLEHLHKIQKGAHMNKCMVTIGGRNIPVMSPLDIPIEQAVSSHIFTDWTKGVDSRFSINSITIQSMDVVKRSGKDHVLFLKIAVILNGEKGPYIRYVFLRGGAVAMLIILSASDAEEYVVLCREKRLAIGRFEDIGLPAGMLDGEGHFVGVAAREIEEELGLSIAESELIDLTHEMYKDRVPGVYPSAGACDEFIRLFLCKKYVTFEEIEKLQGRCTGCADEHEEIKLQVVHINEVVRVTSDMKAHSALMLYVYHMDTVPTRLG